MSTLYENIKKHCELNGISGARLCIETGVSKSTLTSLKHGRTKTIGAENLQKFAERLNTTIDALLGSEQKEKSSTPEGVELTETQKKAWELIQNMDEAKLAAFIAGAKAMLDT